ncbi:MAG: hypothetical protein BRC33_13665 [Cyanobacteria bacterium SW_9_44_58]|nr:MAG: hypothetical protein BRC33_13665 [Cyanobacteria bacterium SW_9_44_58]
MWKFKSVFISSLFLFSSLLPEQVNAQATDSCRPEPNPEATQYIVGYGSLMEKESRTRTTSNIGEVKPVMVSGFQRVWGIQGGPATYLAAIPKPEANFNAVTYRLNSLEQLEATDRRERGYCRDQVPKEQLEILAGSVPENAQFWIYTLKQQKPDQPDYNHPIVQSYVDLFISGCLEQQKKFDLEGFAQTCIETTKGWSPYWVNDRIYPRRPFIHEPQAFKIEQLLKEELPKILPYRTIE